MTTISGNVEVRGEVKSTKEATDIVRSYFRGNPSIIITALNYDSVMVLGGNPQVTGTEIAFEAKFAS